MKKIFIAATKENDGKTTIALGLLLNLKEKFKKIAFFKPIGQRYVEETGYAVSKDSFLIEKVCKFRTKPIYMNPLIVKRGFTKKYIQNPNKEKITKKILQAFRKISNNKDVVIIEGTGHAGVGAVFEHSNAHVARLLDAEVIIVSSGGLGRPIDEVFLNYNLFKHLGVKVKGVIINKVLREKIEELKPLLEDGLKRLGINLYGVIPYYPQLSIPTVSQIYEATNYEVITGRENMNREVKNIIVGAMTPHDILSVIKEGSLIITPGDRDDIILATLSSQSTGIEIAGIILTQEIMPHFRILSLLKRTKIPVLLAKEDTFLVATRIHDINVKIRYQDKEKIEIIKSMIREFINIDEIIGG